MFDLEVSEVSSMREYCDYAFRIAHRVQSRETEVRQIMEKSSSCVVSGSCSVCKANTQFAIFSNSEEAKKKNTINWRETLECLGCHLINRKRGAFHLFEMLGMPRTESDIYVSEQSSPLYSVLLASYPKTIGSEYLGDHIPFGERKSAHLWKRQSGRLRNETLTALTFRDTCLDFVLCFEVLEHIPDYMKALRECWRCIRPGGKMFFTVPFNPESQSNIVRATLNPDGSIQHFLPPEFHIDPQRDGGILAYNLFGWDLLDQLQSVGFRKVAAFFYWSLRFAYFGQSNIIFMAEK